VPALLRRPAAGAPSLAPGERAVGVRVDDVTGLPRLLAVGSRVDVLVSVRGGQAMRAETVAGNVEVIAEPAETPGGEGWAIVLRLPAAIAATVAAAQADGREIRLLSRSGAP
jgi:Flp pilus assembly protein CpaB